MYKSYGIFKLQDIIHYKQSHIIHSLLTLLYTATMNSYLVRTLDPALIKKAR